MARTELTSQRKIALAFLWARKRQPQAFKPAGRLWVVVMVKSALAAGMGGYAAAFGMLSRASTLLASSGLCRRIVDNRQANLLPALASGCGSLPVRIFLMIEASHS